MTDGGTSFTPVCRCIARPDPESVPLWEHWTCPECGREWIADEPAPQMLVTWIPAASWQWLPDLSGKADALNFGTSFPLRGGDAH